MYELPKLVVEIQRFEQIRYLDKAFFGGNNLLLVEGQLVQSYDELVQLARQERYREKGTLEVKLEPLIGGG
ncbi:MAG: hypothetical protein V1780_02425 [Chloroflexota bacterium]